MILSSIGAPELLSPQIIKSMTKSTIAFLFNASNIPILWSLKLRLSARRPRVGRCRKGFRLLLAGKSQEICKIVYKRKGGRGTLGERIDPTILENEIVYKRKGGRGTLGERIDPTILENEYMAANQITITDCPLQALELLRANIGNYDIVLIDVNLTCIDGFQLLEIVSSEINLSVIVLSVDSNFENVMKSIKYGAANYLVKPVRLKELKLIWKHVRRSCWSCYDSCVKKRSVIFEGTLERELLKRSRICERKAKVSLSVREKECEGITRLLRVSCTLAPPVALTRMSMLVQEGYSI
ncbi:hypothetical protein IEQ34_007610 [Dendrobium chrysotoxum]|uniref:Response regulatory domain-containing protein n=1 Tax=Dendrobium chrysotoxum TaxID=161865 RepID=A0AAV7H643_DENCH|nr:hypothetical protein IEQ34_007610 [Dendrobium chrysotoxum]